jgi:site-specific DNA-methyltransferase (adenine-specific)
MSCSLYLNDCLDVENGMSKIKTKSVAMVLCDLPYSMTKNHWDQRIDMKALWTQYMRIIKDNGVICLFVNQPFTSELVMACPKYFRYSLVWEKNKFSDFLNCKRKPLKIHEDIMIFYKKQPTYNPQYTFSDPYVRWNKQEAVDKQTNYGKMKENRVVNTDGKRYPTTVLKFNRVETPQHPTQKPTDLCEWLIRTYTNEGDLICDNCFGSGTTAEACFNTKRSFVGFEMEKIYFDIACKRLNTLLKDNSKFQRAESDDDTTLHKANFVWMLKEERYGFIKTVKRC